ncbi:hypothetical protein T261_4121 [Streptomyces lydicus]|nr:hypothetical protein T261_4121 [Streptomyces lydicus]
MARRGQALDVCQMLLSTDGPQGQAHAGRSSAGVSPLSGLRLSRRSLL